MREGKQDHTDLEAILEDKLCESQFVPRDDLASNAPLQEQTATQVQIKIINPTTSA